MATYEARQVSVSVERDWREAYDFARVPENFALWAAGLGSGLEKSGDEWLARDPGGHAIRIRFTPRNDFGVLDHTVTTEAGENHNPLRIVANGSGCEVTFIVFRTPGRSAEDFEADAAAVSRDLNALKALLER
jgi:hypothetical protein